MPTATLPPLIEPTGQRPVPVSELFYSFQGEGVNLGRRALFVRFMGCNLTCGHSTLPSTAGTPPEGPMVCDTEYTWNGARHDLTAGVRHLTAEQIWDALVELDPSTADSAIAPVDLIVASGGEPLLRKDTLLRLAGQARRTGRRMEIETNELQDSGQARWKFVVCGAGDLDEIAALQREFGLTEIWLSPEGTTPAAVTGRLRMAADASLARGWNLTVREHVLIWGDDRGR
jgi:7-carboxy-7-deazaguanine synthase